MSGEIVLEKLIDRFIRTAIEHAGAERGLLILARKESYQIEAEAATIGDKVQVRLRQTPVTSSELPESVLHYVIRTRQSVILDDALIANPFSEDEHLRRKRSKSILCLPLVKQAKLVGALYLENNLISHAFTPDRLAILELLASQAAISLDHARLYAELAQENSDRRRAEEALRASEERWRKFFENSSAGIALNAPDGHFIAANPTLQKTLCFTEQELQKLNVLDLTLEEDRPATERRLAESAEGQRRVHRIEKRFLRKDGSVMWADVSTVFVPTTGGTSGFFATVVVDITERKRAEQAERESSDELRRVMASVSDYLWSAEVDRHGEFVYRYYSPVVETITGRPPEFYLVSPERWASTVHPEDRPRCAEAFQRLRAGRSSREEAEYRIILPDGAVRWVRDSVRSEATDDGGLRIHGVVSNITERKRAEEALRQSEQRLEDIIDNTTAVIFVKDLELRYLLVNREYERIHHIQRDQARGKTDFDIHPHDVAEALRANDRRVIEAGEPIQFEEAVPSDEGERLYVVAKFLLRDPQGKPYAVCGIATDITERKRAESEIRQLNASLEKRVAERTIELARSEEKFRGLFEGTSQAIVLHDENGIVEANPSWLRLLGYSNLDDVIGKNLDELSAPIQPEGESAEVLGKEHVANALVSGSTRFEWTMLRRDGTQLPMEVFLTRIELGGRQLFRAICIDITQRKLAQAKLRESEARLRESEQRFSRAFGASPALMTIARLSDGKFVEANGAFVRWFGLNRDGILGRDSWELGLWLNLDARKKFWAGLRLYGSLREAECQFRTWRGTVHTVLVSADIIEVNREPHVLGFFLDVTERKRVESELLRTVAREKELSRLRSNFVSMVSHEFRTPLGIIQSSAEILEDYLEQLEPAEREDHFQSIRNNTRRMAQIMEEVLLIGSFEAGKMEFKPAALDFGILVRSLVEEVNSATHRRCPIDLSLCEMPIEFQGDERLLRHIFTNLLTNAIKYSHAGQLARFEIGRTETEIVCTVRDEGIGIPDADREWLFTAFHRGHNVNDRPGTGLGLVIVKRCVDLHGGEINVESKLGEGTSVTVRLPILNRECRPPRL